MAVKILGIIPARYASVRLPAKLLIPVQGKTILQRTYENAARAKIIDRLLVATDDVRIFDHVNSFGGSCIMTSVTCQNGTDRIGEVLQQHPQFLETDAIVNVQGDYPCADPNGIEKAISLLLKDPLASMATLIAPLNNEEDASNPSIVKCVKDLHNNAMYFSRSLIPSNKTHTFHCGGPYYQHIGLYVYRPEFLIKYQSLPATPLQMEEDLEQLKALEHGFRIKVALTEKAGIAIDTQEDLNQFEQWICTQNTFL